MRVVIVAYGSWGDVRPNVVLGQALQKAGYEVLLLAAEEFRQWVQDRGLAFTPLSVNIQALMESLATEGTNVFTTIQTVKRVIAPAMVEWGQEIAAAVREGDAFLLNEGGAGLVNGIIEKYHLRPIFVNLQPLAPTREFPPISVPALPAWIPGRGAYNRAMGGLGGRISWSLFGPRGNQLRTEHLDLPKQTWAKHKAMLDATPSLLMVSRHVISPPADWKPHQHVTGYVFDDDSAWEAPQDLLDFLSGGEKPVYIGFGSMGDRKAEATTRLVLDGVRRSGKRAVLLSGWGGIGAEDLPKDVFLLKYAPHSWLFPRMAAIVHHGGAGTTGAGLASGVPAIVVPFFGDQPFWAQRVYDLGVGTQPIPRTKLTAEKLATAIGEATSNRAMQDQAAELSRKIAAEDGVGEAVKVISEILK